MYPPSLLAPGIDVRHEPVLLRHDAGNIPVRQRTHFGDKIDESIHIHYSMDEQFKCLRPGFIVALFNDNFWLSVDVTPLGFGGEERLHSTKAGKRFKLW